MPKVKITETILRDAHQSLIATRMSIDEMTPIISKLDEVGYHSLEAWGGATFDSCIRFLNEDPWERLRKIKSIAKNTKLQMLLRGQNLLGYKHYADDVVEYFVQKAIANGIDIIRIFDALNDFRNIEASIKACKKEGGHAQGTLSYTISPVHTIDTFVDNARTLRDMGADSICIKDMAGLLLPNEAYTLVSAIKENVDIPIQLHTHYTSGVASMTYLKAIEAGIDVVDCAMSPFAMGTSQPPTEAIVAALKGTEYDTGYDLNLLSDIADYFRPIKEKYIETGLLNTKMMGVDVNTLKYQVPGGMLSNLVSQLKEANAEDKYEDVLKEIPRVREDFGYPPLVTPTSQIVGTQAVMNVLSGERYKLVPKESKGLVKGEYGKTPATIPDEIIEKILKGEERITCRPADLIEPELESIREAAKNVAKKDEDYLTYAMFPQVAMGFFNKRDEVVEEKPTVKAGNDKNVIAAISATIYEISKETGTNLKIRSIKKKNAETNYWNLSNKMSRFGNKL